MNHLEDALIAESLKIVPQPMPSGRWAVEKDIGKATVTRFDKSTLPVAQVTFELEGRFEAKKPVLAKYTLYETVRREDGGTEEIEKTYSVAGGQPSFLIGGYRIRDKKGKCIESGTMLEDGSRSPLPFATK